MKATVYKNGTLCSKCNVLKRGACRRKAIWIVFGGNGEPFESNIKFFSCSHHLSRAVKETIEEPLSTVIKDEDTFTKEDFNL